MHSAWAGVERSRLTAWLLLGDLVAIAGFVVLGEIRHYPMAVAIDRIPGTLIPFVVGWVLAAPVAGLFAPSHRRRPGSIVLRTTGAWIAATGVAMGLRALPQFHGSADATFALVAIGVGLVLLVPWRLVAATGFGRSAEPN